MTKVERHGTGLSTWFWRNSIWIAPVVGFGISIGITWVVFEFL